MKRCLFILFVFVLSLPQVSSADSASVRVAQYGKEKFLLYLPLYIAMEEGYFKENGVNVELVFAGNDDQVFAAVASGSVEFGVSDPVFTAIAQEKGFPAKTVAMLIRKLGNSGYTKDKSITPIQSLDDLAGLRIGSLPKPSTTYTLLDEIIRRNPNKLGETKIVQAGIGAQLALLEAGKADIAVDLEPSVSRLEAEGYRVVFDLSEHIDPQVITGLMTTEKIIETKAPAVFAMVAALNRALGVLHSDRELAIDVAKRLFPDLAPEICARAVNRMIAKEVYPRSVLVPDAYWQRSLQTRLDSGQLQKPQATSVSVDNRFC